MERRKPYSYRSDPRVPGFPDDRPLVIFDGVCVFCSRGAQFLIRVDRKGAFRLAAAQSELGQALYRHYGLDGQDYETNLLIEDGLPWLKSDGAIRVSRRLGLPWSALALLAVLPKSWRDRLYDVLARNRYRWFGRRETCFVPDAAERGRFIA